MSSPPTDRFFGDFLDEFIQCSHPEKVLNGYPCADELDDQMLARIYCITPERYRELREACARRSAQAAAELLRDQRFAQLVDGLPFGQGAVVVAVGDSMTDDWQSWAYILEELMLQRRSEGEIRVVNAGKSGDTSLDLLRRLESIVALNPDWIITLIGTNDACAFGPSPSKTLVSTEETKRNFCAIRETLIGDTPARLVWLTPPPVSLEDFTRSMHLQKLTIAVSNENLLKNGEIVREFPDPVIDLWPAFGNPPRPELFFDGLHPNLDGHMQIVTTMVARLSKG